VRPLGALLLLTLACSSPAAQPTPRPTAPPPTRAAPQATPTPDPGATALAIVPLKIDESALPPPEPTSIGFTSGRATPTPFATPEPAWKYLTITFGIENRSDRPRLVGIAGSDPTATNLSGAVLTSRDGTRYKALRSITSFGLRTATARSLTTYPVLLRLPPSFRVAAESAGSLSVVAPVRSQIVYKVPSALTDYGTLSIPPLGSLGPKTGEDDVTRQLRPLIGGFQLLELGGQASAIHSVAFPFESTPNSIQATGTPVTVAGKGSVSLVSLEAADPADYEVRNRGWKLITLSLQYAAQDSQSARGFSEAGWLFGEDGVVYTGDAPTIGDFGRSVGAPDPGALLLWDGRSVGTDQVSAGQLREPRRATFLVPRELSTAVLVLSGDVEATFSVTGIPSPLKP
jgi:hypothetical protein